MDLIERYLRSVKFWLPKNQKDDIIAELSEDIHARMEEQESALGRSLNEAEVEALLKKRGRPFVVANRFLPQQSLIGPLLFPLYFFILKIMALCYAVAFVAVLFLGWIPASRVLMTGITDGCILTVIFAMLERWQSKSNFMEDWNPRRLPRVHDSKLISRTGSCIEIAVYLVVLVWWVDNLSSRVVTIQPGLQIVLAPVWPWFFWGFLALDLSSIAQACVNIVRPYWTINRALWRLLSSCAGSALFCWLIQANVLKSISVADVSAARALEITNAINFWVSRSFVWVLITVLIIAASDVYRLVRLRAKKPEVQRPSLASGTI